MVHVPALGLSKYTVGQKSGNKQNYISNIVLYNAGDLQGSPWVSFHSDLTDIFVKTLYYKTIIHRIMLSAILM